MRLNSIIYSILLISLFAFFSCGNKSQKSEKSNAKESVIQDSSEALKLVKYLEETGDYVNSREFPSLIKASKVYEQLDGNIHIVDLRLPEVYKRGHIKNAVNVRFSDLPNYFESQIVPFKFDKIIMVCYGGQISSYATSLLRLMGYGNVYSMRWGMSVWNKEFAKDYWLVSTSSEYQDSLELAPNKKNQEGSLPQLNTGLESGEEILNARIKDIFNEGLKNTFVGANQVFEDPAKYYIINYDRKDKYLAGHIPGAIRYKPNATLGIVSVMKTIPTNKEVVVYCGTGHSSGFTTAYLRLLGYNVHTLENGNNAFMYDKMLEEKSTLSWLPFTEQEINDYPYVKK